MRAIIDRFVALERALHALIDGIFGGRKSESALEIRHQVVDAVTDQVRIDRDGAVFPFNRVRVRLIAADGNEKSSFEALFVDGKSLEKDIRAALTAELRRPAVEVEVQVAVEEGEIPLGGQRYAIDFDRRPADTPKGRSRRGPEATFAVVRGVAEPMSFRVTRHRTYIGRLREVIDEDGQIVRRNDIAFVDNGDEINSTVSRQHATLIFDDSDDTYRLVDDGSEYGTRIFRENRRTEVPPGQRRGVVLYEGDEVYLGQARLRFKRLSRP